MYISSRSPHGGEAGINASSTLPVKGLCYLSSPALPSTVQKSLGLLGVASAAATMNASMYGRLEPLAGGGTTPPTEINFSDTLSNIGPSARRLLMLDAASRAGDAGRGTVPDASRCAGTTPHNTGGAAPGPWTTPNRTAGVSAKTASCNLTATLDGTLRRSHKVSRGATGDRRLDTAISSVMAARPGALAVNGIGNTSLSRNPELEPPLVVTLRRYLEREIRLAKDGSPTPSATDQLGAYREAFGALITAFPGYSSLLCDIKAAYENVVQLQAELLTQAYMDDRRRTETSGDAKAELRGLTARVADLDHQLRAAHTEMEQRERLRAAERTANGGLTSAGARAANFDLHRQLDGATTRIEELQGASRSDLEKMLVLIAAVRECDKRIKELETSVNFMSGQVNELDEFKRLAGEAQGDLQRYRERYSTYVPESDFDVMKEYLVAQLSTAESLVKRLRRTAAVRATQLDVMDRRIAGLELHVDNLQQRGADQDGEPRELMTPRPDWASVEEAFPDMTEFSKPSHSYPLPGKAARTSAAVLALAGAPPTGTVIMIDGTEELEEFAEDPNAPGSELLVAPGPDTTAMRIGFLVECIHGLRERVAALQDESDERTSATRQAHAAAAATLGLPTVLPKPNGAGGERGDTRRPPTGKRPSTCAHPANDRSRGPLAIAPDLMHGGTVDSSLCLAMPLLGLGIDESVPPHLRCTGFVPRTTVDLDAGVLLTFEFFVRELKAMMCEQVTQLATPEVGEGEYRPPGTPVAADPQASAPFRFSRFLAAVLEHGGLPNPVTARDTSAKATRGRSAPSRSFFTSASATTLLNLPFSGPAHLAMNLDADARDSHTTNPPLLLCSYVLRGMMPVRLAVEAASVVERVVTELTALATEAQKPRLQRSTISESLQPILELRRPAEVAELRAALGPAATFDVISLTSMRNDFLRTLFFQECRANMAFYTCVVSALTARAEPVDQSTLADGAACADGDRLIALDNIAATLAEVEPRTPSIVIRELSENAVTLGETAVSPDDGGNDSPSPLVRLSDIIRALAEAPVIRRTCHSTGPDAAL